ncbi:MAG: TonB-dependent receptor [Desulfuromonadales bacterium]
MLSTRFAVTCVISALLYAPCLFAAEPILLEEIVIKGEELPSNEETLTIREVRESPARDIGEAVEMLPGLFPLRKGAVANDIVLRGLQGDDINVLMDGVRVQGGCPSRMDPPSFHFDFAEVDSIEVIKGPYDLRYAGGMGGLVNAISKSPKPGLNLSAVATYGSYEQIQGSLTGSYATDDYDALLGYAYKYSKPPKSGDGKRITDIYPETSKNRYYDSKLDSRAYDINTGWVKGGYRLTSKARTELGFAYQDAEHVLYPALYMDADHDRTRRVNWTTTVDSPSDILDEVRFQVYWDDVDHLMHDEFRVSSTPSMLVTRDYSMETDADTTSAGGNISGAMILGPGRLNGGIDTFYRNWNATNRAAVYMNYANQPMIPDVDEGQVGLYAEYTWPVTDRVKLKGGARVDYADADATKLDNSRLASLYQPYYPGKNLDKDNDFFEPSANIQLFWQAAPGIEIFTGLASASRMPDPQELYIGLQRIPTMMMPTATNWIGNPALDPPRNNQADLGIKFTGETFYLNGSVFYSHIDDYINIVDVDDPDGPEIGTLPPAKTYHNVDARLWGGELSSQVSLPFDLFLMGKLSYTNGENLDTNEPLSEIPPLSGSVGLRYDTGTWFAEIQEKFAAKQDRVDDNLNEDKTSGWGITNLKAGANLERWAVIAGVDNVFDKFYYTHLSYQRDPFRTGERVPEPGAFAFVTVMYKY